MPTHTVSLEEGSLVHKIFGTPHLRVNSFHHQAVSKPGSRLKVSAIAPDDVIEAVESTEYKSVLGVQWHLNALLPQATAPCSLFSSGL